MNISEVEGTIISFCTNPMLDRGKVYNCLITNGRAIVQTSQSWDCMRFADTKHRIGEDLGAVVSTYISGSLMRTWGIESDRGIIILRQGRG